MERRKSLLLMVGRRSAARQGKYLGVKFTLFLVNEILQVGTNLREDLSSWDAKGEVKLMFLNQLNNSFLLFFSPLYNDGDGILPPTSPGLMRRRWCRPRHSCSRCSPPATALQGLRKSDTHGQGPVCRIHDIHQLCHLLVRGRRGIDAQMESMDLEREKGITIQSAATCCTLNGYQITRDCCKTYQKNTSQSKMTYETKREAFIIQC